MWQESLDFSPVHSFTRIDFLYPDENLSFRHHHVPLSVNMLYLPDYGVVLAGRRRGCYCSRERCINHDKPELMCQGSCYINQCCRRHGKRGASMKCRRLLAKETDALFRFPAGSSYLYRPSFDFFLLSPISIPLVSFFYLVRVFFPPRFA